jgi:tetratricopeptide (TPR) repeat protein
MKPVQTRGTISRIARHAACAIPLALSVTSACLFALTIPAQQAPSSQRAAITLDGNIRDESGKAVSAATVSVTATGGTRIVKTKSNADGSFRLILTEAGTFRIEAEKTGVGKAAVEASQLKLGDARRCDLVLSSARTAPASSSASGATAGGFEFNDEPNFTVAGVTDWSNAGLHGSDARARTSDALTKETVALSGAVEKSIPVSPNAAYHLATEYREKGDFSRARTEARKSLTESDTADGHRLLGDLEERLGESVEAVREFQLAARMDPSEQNYFAWGTELLLHKAAQPAAEVFAKGSRAHPDSARLLAGLGVALYAVGSYDEAAQRLCAASDMKPAEPAPYLFLGEIEKSSAAPLMCSKERFVRFVREQPENAQANYYYAMSLWKSVRDLPNQTGSPEIERLLEKAIRLDARLTDAYVQLGILRAARGDLAAAIESYKRALAVDPDSSDAHYRLGLAYKRTDEDAKARQELDAYEHARKSESATVERQQREMKQFSIIFKDRTEIPAAPNSKPH